MISIRSSLSPTRCRNCHRTVLDAFASLAGIYMKPSPPKSYSTQFPVRSLASSHSFQKLASRRHYSAQPTDLQLSQAHDEAVSNEQQNTEEKNVESSSSLPWYLQVDAPQRVISPLSGRQRLPELPPNPPPLLQAILEHISVDIGLDDLFLLDLRRIDPPPALGANLIMIIGTARSEKHLHVSADRFCRWLRSTHNLSPYADGLLGRGELKIKLKRKARRARLLSSVGSSESSNADDGIRTGWVCVNVGTIEDAENSSDHFRQPEGFVGFGEEVKGTKIVIQMLVEEKRQELDLESLWGGILARYENRETTVLKTLEEPDIHQDVGSNSLLTESILSDHSSRVPFSHHNLPIHNHQQRRNFHIVVRRRISNLSEQGPPADHALDSSSVEPRIQLPVKSSAASHKMNLQLPTESDVKLHLKLAPPSENRRMETEDFSASIRLLTMKAHLRYLKSLPREVALEVLGSGVQDFGSTTFLVSFYQSFPLFPDSSHWDCRLELICYAIDLDHPGYKWFHVMSTFDEINASLVEISSCIYKKILDVLLFPNQSSLKSNSKNHEEDSIQLIKIDKAVQVVEVMKLRGHDIFNPDILVNLYIAVAAAPIHSQPELSVQHHVRPDAAQRLSRIMDQVGINITDFNIHYQILDAFADRDNWTGFWVHWQGFARRMQAKPKELYIYMFRRIARTGHQANCMDAIRTWVPEIFMEEPAVSLHEVAGAIMDCLVVAAPDVVNTSYREQHENDEWVKLWRRCRKAIRAVPPVRHA